MNYLYFTHFMTVGTNAKVTLEDVLQKFHASLFFDIKFYLFGTKVSYFLSFFNIVLTRKKKLTKQ